MARTVKLTSNTGVRNSLPAIFGAAALVAAGALAGAALTNGGPDGRDGRHPGRGAEARMEMDRDRDRAGEGGEHRGAGGPHR